MQLTAIKFYLRLCVFASFYFICTCSLNAQQNLLEQSNIKPLETQEARNQLQAELRAAVQFAEQQMTSLTTQLQSKATKKKERSAVVDWQKLVVERTREVLNSEPPMRALLDSWALSEQVLDYVTKGGGRNLFREQQPMAVATAGVIRDRIAQIADQHLEDPDFERAKENIRVYVSENPLKKKSFFSGLFGVPKNLFSVVDVGRNTLSTVAAVPLFPGRAAQGIQKGTEEFATFNETAQRFTQILEKMPEQIRVQVEQLLTRLADNYTTFGPMLADVQNTAASLDSMMASADSVTTNVQSIIITARESAPAFTQTIDAVSSASRALQDLTAAVADLMEQTKGKEPTAPAATAMTPTSVSQPQAPPFDPEEYQQAASAIGSAAVEVRRVVEEIRLMTEKEKEDDVSDKDEKPGRPFDIREYTATARAIDGAAGSLHATLADVRTMGRTGEIASASLALQTSVTAIVDRATLRIVQLLAILFVLIFVLAVLYQLIRHALLARRARNTINTKDAG